MKKSGILAVVIIGLVVGGLYIIKNSQREDLGESQTESLPVQETGSEEAQGVEGEIDTESEVDKVEKDEPTYGSEEERDFSLYDGQASLDELKAYGKPIIYTIGQESCTFCHRMKPGLEALNDKYQGQLIIKYISLDDYPEVGGRYPIQGVPATIVVDGEGRPYEPSEAFMAYVSQYTTRDSDVPALSIIFGMVEEAKLEELIGELL